MFVIRLLSLLFITLFIVCVSAMESGSDESASAAAAVASVAAAGVAAFAALTKGQRQDAKRKHERALIREAKAKVKADAEAIDEVKRLALLAEKDQDREKREKGKQEVKQRKAAEKAARKVAAMIAANFAKEDEAALLKASRASKEEQNTPFQNQTP